MPKFAFVFAGLILAVANAGAVTLDWNNVNWTNESLDQSFNVDGVAGNDIRIRISGATNRLNDDSPDDTTAYTGGFGNTQESLRLGVDFQSGESLVTRITFNNPGGVQAVSFYLFDIDFASGQFIDRVGTFQAYRNGVLVASYATLTGSAYNTVTNNNTANAAATGHTANAEGDESLGNVLVSFNSPITIDEVRFTYSNLAATPGQQAITIYDINYTPVPEGSSILCALLLGAVFGSRAWRRKAGMKSLAIAG